MFTTLKGNMKLSAHIFLIQLFLSIGTSLPAMELEARVIALAGHWEKEMALLTQYHGLASFCQSADHREGVFGLLDDIHNYHGLLYQELLETTHHHSARTIRRILKHLDKLEANYNIQSFNAFFGERCEAQRVLETMARQYKSGFGMHSYDGKIHVLEIEMHRYLKTLTKRISKVKKHVSRFYVRRQVWDY